VLLESQRYVAAGAMVLLATASSSCGTDSPSSGTARPSPSVPHLIPVVRLGFDDARLQGSRVITRNDAGTHVSVRVVTAADGSLTAVRGFGGGRGIRFPVASESKSPPRAVLVVTTKDSFGGVSRLSPGSRAFEFGARFKLDPVSEVGTLDNGNNLVQRGLYGRSQYKLQVDHRHVSCRVAGGDGAVEARSHGPVQDDEWFSATCARMGNALTLVVHKLDGGATDRSTARGRIGAVDPPASIPLSVGGKASNTGRVIRGNSDQFNGLIDDVFLDVGADG
jgi:Laminin G domain